ncbi:anthranilate phosphoribosyltransferase [Thiohalobacter sp. IOR34]|uniref:anthranilate phosphoribosyltransferase n=1 Tax=Thiohalobacter sp. IOR34 TaxID=3057176 RepID=UPI0025B235E9|nr:anthranilate phosphoribosyltransferase [Thiohalobacter sp. IOR34]WJW74330.1 anthranilate phosphoribosyltransferase [Thiohalobacter sp. IOR34]
MNAFSDKDAALLLRSCIQKVATGPEYSKDLSFDEARDAMRIILSGQADPVQTAILFIALRMKRESDAENRGVLQAILDARHTATAEVDELVDIADPYDGYTRGLPVSPFVPALLAACGVPAVSHGLDTVGPKYGITHHKVLKAAGVDVDLSPEAAAGRIAETDIGWAYVDQRHYCPPLHDLVPLRQRMVKRQVLTTVEVLSRPISGRKRTHLYTGFVHKAYPPIYASLARHAGFDSLLLVRGVEGGIIPSLQQPARIVHYHDRGPEEDFESQPQTLGIEAENRAVPIPADAPAAAQPGDEIATAIDSDAMAALAAEYGREALRGKRGGSYDGLVYAGALVLHHLGRCDSLPAAAETARKALDSGAALAHFEAAT